MLIFLAAQVAAALGPDAAVGHWQTPTRHGLVEIARCGASLCGRLVASDGLRANPQLRDEKNRSAALRGRALKDLTILDGFAWKPPAWAGGKIYNADDGGTYGATITATDRDRLSVKGCIVWPLCKTQIWERVR